ncbi:hypothetical protein D3C75_940200 [compost metagenome]
MGSDGVFIGQVVLGALAENLLILLDGGLAVFGGQRMKGQGGLSRVQEIGGQMDVEGKPGYGNARPMERQLRTVQVEDALFLGGIGQPGAQEVGFRRLQDIKRRIESEAFLMVKGRPYHRSQVRVVAVHLHMDRGDTV